jgi:hypothetical protein
MHVALTEVPRFTPRTLTINLENQEEFDLLAYLFKRHIIIPKHLVSRGDLTKERLPQLMALMEEVHLIISTNS